MIEKQPRLELVSIKRDVQEADMRDGHGNRLSPEQELDRDSVKTDLARAFASEVGSGSREEKASRQIAGAVVTEDTGANRFNMALEGGTAYATFRRQDGLLVISHTEVPRALRGRGIGSQLVHGIFELARRRGEKILPACPFVAEWAHRHPEYADLMPSGR